MNKKALIIGAGQAGRGYIGRLLAEIGYQITFVDKSQKLIDLLNKDKHFSVHFYDKDRTPVIIENYTAYHVDDICYDEAIKANDLIITATGEQNLSDVINRIYIALSKKTKTTVLLTCENGINPAKKLAYFLEKAGGYDKSKIFISQTAEFCSVVNLVSTRLDILSQNENFFPYDADGYQGILDINGAVPVHNFEQFLKRKIYTYNCLAGLISYCGYIKGYDIFGEAANDKEISALMDILLKELNPALAKYFSITEKEQYEFSQRALAKFKNKNILDYVIKNGRAPKRKLGSTERIYAPLQIIKENGGDYKILCFVAAAAFCYWQNLSNTGKEEPLDKNPREILCDLWNLDKENEIITLVLLYLQKINTEKATISILKILDY